MLILVGSRVFLDEVGNRFSAELKRCIAGTVPMNLKPWPSAQSIADATRDLDFAAERAREAQAVTELLELAGQQQASLGPQAVLDALQAVMSTEGLSTTGSDLPRTQAAADLDAAGGVGVLLRNTV